VRIPFPLFAGNGKSADVFAQASSSYNLGASVTSGRSLFAACHQKGIPQYILYLQGLPDQGGFAQDPGAPPGHPLRLG